MKMFSKAFSILTICSCNFLLKGNQSQSCSLNVDDIDLRIQTNHLETIPITIAMLMRSRIHGVILKTQESLDLRTSLQLLLGFEVESSELRVM